MYTSSPLPFIGQKRLFAKHFIHILNTHIPNQGEGWTIVDAFGGSGLLSHITKHTKPQARVIYNDFDGFSKRLQHIEETNALRRQIQAALTHAPRGKVLSKADKARVIQIIQEFKGFVDLDCIGAWLTFSGQQVASFADFCQKSLYNTVRKSDYPPAEGYLDGLEMTHESYITLIPSFAGKKKVLLVLDPPYVCTKQGAYRQAGYFGMVEFLRLMHLIRPPFVFFSSTRSELLSYLDLLAETKMDGWERVQGYKILSIQSTINKDAQYEDNLIYRF